jgi:hypothetical protein
MINWAVNAPWAELEAFAAGECGRMEAAFESRCCDQRAEPREIHLAVLMNLKERAVKLENGHSGGLHSHEEKETLSWRK